MLLQALTNLINHLLKEVVLAVSYRLRATGMVESVPYDECRHLYHAVGYRYYHTVATQSLVVQEDAGTMTGTNL